MIINKNQIAIATIIFIPILIILIIILIVKTIVIIVSIQINLIIATIANAIQTAINLIIAISIIGSVEGSSLKCPFNTQMFNSSSSPAFQNNLCNSNDANIPTSY